MNDMERKGYLFKMYGSPRLIWSQLKPKDKYKPGDGVMYNIRCGFDEWYYFANVVEDKGDTVRVIDSEHVIREHDSIFLRHFDTGDITQDQLSAMLKDAHEEDAND